MKSMILAKQFESANQFAQVLSRAWQEHGQTCNLCCEEDGDDFYLCPKSQLMMKVYHHALNQSFLYLEAFLKVEQMEAKAILREYKP